MLDLGSTSHHQVLGHTPLWVPPHCPERPVTNQLRKFMVTLSSPNTKHGAASFLHCLGSSISGAEEQMRVKLVTKGEHVITLSTGVLASLAKGT